MPVSWSVRVPRDRGARHVEPAKATLETSRSDDMSMLFQPNPKVCVYPSSKGYDVIQVIWCYPKGKPMYTPKMIPAPFNMFWLCGSSCSMFLVYI